MAAIELLNIDLRAEFEGSPGAIVTFRVTPTDAKASLKPFELEIGVPHMGEYAQTVDRAFRALHRLAQDLDETLR